MIYPVRSLRHIQERQEARIRLLVKYKILYLQTINKKRYRRQPQIKAAKHVQFSGETTVCKYQPNVNYAIISIIYRIFQQQLSLKDQIILKMYEIMNLLKSRYQSKL